MIINPNRHETLVGIDEHVLAELMRRARPFLDEPNDVIRALLGLGGQVAEPPQRAELNGAELNGAERNGASGDPVRGRRPRASRAGASRKPDRAAKGSLTREEEFEIPLLESLERAGGELPTRQALDAVGALMRGTLNEEDRYEDDNGVARWQKRVPFVRLKLVERGLMRSDAPRGVWAISDAGRRHLATVRS